MFGGVALGQASKEKHLLVAFYEDDMLPFLITSLHVLWLYG
jgi:hypothetical protein